MRGVKARINIVYPAAADDWFTLPLYNNKPGLWFRSARGSSKWVLPKPANSDPCRRRDLSLSTTSSEFA
nr:hypothetical protein Iba_chr09aCG11600 [Ipomoea batatas]GMD34150.1 hypothetical protein Iba_chr09cCG9350 [Ipomoea batatas]